jgi:hypothetical protein
VDCRRGKRCQPDSPEGVPGAFRGRKQAQKRSPEKGPREVAEADIGRRFRGNRQPHRESARDFLALPVRPFDDGKTPPVGPEGRRNTAVRNAQHGPAALDGAETRGDVDEVEFFRVEEPRVVRNVDEEIGPENDAFPENLGENRFEADRQRALPRPPGRTDGEKTGTGAGFEIRI